MEREGVDVGAQGDAALAAADVADQAGATGQGARLEAGRGQQRAQVAAMAAATTRIGVGTATEEGVSAPVVEVMRRT